MNNGVWWFVGLGLGDRFIGWWLVEGVMFGVCEMERGVKRWLE